MSLADEQLRKMPRGMCIGFIAKRHASTCHGLQNTVCGGGEGNVHGSRVENRSGNQRKSARSGATRFKPREDGGLLTGASEPLRKSFMGEFAGCAALVEA